MKLTFVPAIALLALAGCSGGNSVPAHTAQEEKALDDYKKMTPQQHIDAIQKGPMPEGAKQAAIQKIKDDNGIK